MVSAAVVPVMFRLPVTALASTTSMLLYWPPVAASVTLVPVKSEVSSRVSSPVPPVTVAAPAPSTKVVATLSLPVRVTADAALASMTSMPDRVVPSRLTLPVTVLASFRVSVPSPPVTVSEP